MKNMLIAASALGAAIAGLVLYYGKKNKGRKALNGVKLPELERPAMHTMG
jgi:hypothetical protein